jgi:hypothetical protein
MVGSPCTIRIETIETTREGQSMDGSPGTSPAQGARPAEAMVQDLPLIRKARDVLGAQVLQGKTDPGFGADDPAANGPAVAEQE